MVAISPITDLPTVTGAATVARASIGSMIEHMTQRQIAVWVAIYTAEEPPTVRGLSSLLGISKPAVVRSLDRLEKETLVKRVPDPNDRRSITIERTKEGKAALTGLEKRLRNLSAGAKPAKKAA